jgi:predicted GIY-YIG superfamily endonuclease
MNGCYIERGGQRVVYCADCGKAQRYNASNDEAGDRGLTVALDFTLYRIRSSSGTLLYVGITNDWPSRMKQHSKSQPWWTTVAATEFVHMSCSRKQAEAIEKAVIHEELPLHNKQHNTAERDAAQPKWIGPAYGTAVEPRPSTADLISGSSPIERLAQAFPGSALDDAVDLYDLIEYEVGDKVRDAMGGAPGVGVVSERVNDSVYLVQFPDIGASWHLCSGELARAET